MTGQEAAGGEGSTRWRGGRLRSAPPRPPHPSLPPSLLLSSSVPPGVAAVPRLPPAPPEPLGPRRRGAGAAPPGQGAGGKGREGIPALHRAGSRGSAIPYRRQAPGRARGGGTATPERPRRAHRFRHLPGGLGTAARSSCAAGALRTASNGTPRRASRPPVPAQTPPPAAFLRGRSRGAPALRGPAPGAGRGAARSSRAAAGAGPGGAAAGGRSTDVRPCPVRRSSARQAREGSGADGSGPPGRKPRGRGGPASLTSGTRESPGLRSLFTYQLSLGLLVLAKRILLKINGFYGRLRSSK